MGIGSVDMATTNILEKRVERRSRSKSTTSEAVSLPICSTSLQADIVTTPRARPDFSKLFSDTSPPSDASDEDNALAGWEGNVAKTYNTLAIPNVAKAADRYDISDSATAAIVSAGFLDAGLISSEDMQYVVDRSKVQRARRALRSSSVESISRVETLHAFFFDGRKDQTRKYQFGRLRKVKEEHISILQEPGSLFFSHVTVHNGDAGTIRIAIWDRLQDKNVDLSTIKAIGSDGTNVNVGRENGVLRYMELSLKTHVHWFVCLLHANELPLRVLTRKYIGKTNDPRTFEGPLGKKLKICRELPIVQFQRIPFAEELKEFNTSLLNTDYKYLVDICQVISTGIVPEKFDQRDPGKTFNF